MGDETWDVEKEDFLMQSEHEEQSRNLSIHDRNQTVPRVSTSRA